MNQQRAIVNESKIDEFIKRLKAEGIGKIEKKELLKPDGYAAKISRELDLSRVQLRKIFSEFKIIKEKYDKYQQSKSSKLKQEIDLKIYKLYPLLQYQVNRGVVNERFKKMIFQILENLENNIEENMDNAYEFLEALVAYAPKKS
ncbi:MAG: type III-A CRISPR-associated protein Csm2 [Caldimicrobium sp.]